MHFRELHSFGFVFFFQDSQLLLEHDHRELVDDFLRGVVLLHLPRLLLLQGSDDLEHHLLSTVTTLGCLGGRP